MSKLHSPPSGPAPVTERLQSDGGSRAPLFPDGSGRHDTAPLGTSLATPPTSGPATEPAAPPRSREPAPSGAGVHRRWLETSDENNFDPSRFQATHIPQELRLSLLRTELPVVPLEDIEKKVPPRAPAPADSATQASVTRGLAAAPVEPAARDARQPQIGSKPVHAAVSPTAAGAESAVRSLGGTPSTEPARARADRKDSSPGSRRRTLWFALFALAFGAFGALAAFWMTQDPPLGTEQRRPEQRRVETGVGAARSPETPAPNAPAPGSAAQPLPPSSPGDPELPPTPAVRDPSSGAEAVPGTAAGGTKPSAGARTVSKKREPATSRAPAAASSAENPSTQNPPAPTVSPPAQSKPEELWIAPK